MAKITYSASRCLILIVRAYQYLLSPLLGYCCRFHPTCSSYTINAIKIHGCIKGCYFGFRRILRCHPWHAGGIDPVPEKNPKC